MYLKSLTVKGFKSFAHPITLEFTQGVSCIVGPNGSGKSNILDAIEWCLGEQGVKSLRANSMDDIIFFGSTAKQRLSRADVICTFDNEDRKIPIDFSEVEIKRAIFREGTSQYFLNGEQVRLNYIQKLLSNAGLGRQMHVIVGQGKLDSVLSAPPEKRRAFIEEAAGILDYRYRKEKAVRQLDSILVDMTRLNDIVEELKKQAGPLKRQAKIASESEEIKNQTRTTKSILLLDDYIEAKSAQGDIVKEFEKSSITQKQLLEEMNKLRKEVLQLETAASNDSEEVQKINQIWQELILESEKLRTFITVTSEKIKLESSKPFAPVSSADKKLLEDIEKIEKSLEEKIQKHHKGETKIASLKSKIDTLSLTLDADSDNDFSIAKGFLDKKFLSSWYEKHPEKSLSQIGAINNESDFAGIIKSIADRFFVFDNIDNAKKHLLKKGTDFACLLNGDIIISSQMFQSYENMETLEEVYLAAKQDLSNQAEIQEKLELLISAENKELSKLKEQQKKIMQEQEMQTAENVKKLKAQLEDADKNLDAVNKKISDIELERTEVSKTVLSSDSHISKLRNKIDKINEKLNSNKDATHKIDLQKSELEMTLNSFRAKAVESLGAAIEELEKENSSISFPLDDNQKADYLLALDKLTVKLARLGRVNPLALEEYESIQERYTYLSDQYNDLEKTRVNLKKIISDLEEKIDASFNLAFDDTAREFDKIFQQLFPGGAGKLVLTDSENGAGIDVIASPEGKKMISLNLMSGGERSLIALAMLVAIFKARPSPFYILDEVEAALDDVNLQRVLKLFETLKSSSQLMIITHQKSTMEVADTLYGVTMKGDGITRVYSHKVK
ncbi:MAG: chromosome segregation protein SMC [Bifidobacteriaceae bacterium]|jgi:chromosome segregation protein|nr:chromosome segregation protein SMC [Bifidobacteriaceae bacterium]